MPLRISSRSALSFQTSICTVAELAQPILGLKRGRVTFSHPAAVIHRPDAGAAVFGEPVEGFTPAR